MNHKWICSICKEIIESERGYYWAKGVGGREKPEYRCAKCNDQRLKQEEKYELQRRSHSG